MSCSWEVIFEFMERGGHDPISEIEGFFDSVSMMNIDVDVEHSLIGLE